jgi:MFS family permease
MTVALEGFDLVVLGVVLPALLEEPGWGLTPNTASLVSVIGLVGVMVGALTVGTISDYIGRRQTMLWTVISFSILTLLCAFAPNPWIFGLLRFLAGLGLGGVLPTALALVNEYATRGRGGAATTNMMTGYHVGAVLTALLGIIIIEPLGWHWMFVVGALPALVLVPVMWRYLPESAAFLRVRAAWPTGPPPAPPPPGPTRSARCSTTGSAGRRSRSGSPRSWACCWSTA